MKKFMRRSISLFSLLLILVTYDYFAYAEWSQHNSHLLTLELNKGTIVEVNKNTGSVFIADPAIADFHLKAPGVLYIYTKKIGTTSLYVTDKKGRVSYKYTIRVTHNLSELQHLLRVIVPGADIIAMSANDNIVLRGNVRSAAQAEDAKRIAEKYIGDPTKVLTFLHVTAPTQVNLRVQVIEMARDVIRSIGINWSTGFAAPHAQIAVNPLLIPTDFAQSSSLLPPDRVAFTGLLQKGNFSITATAIDILEQNGLVSILSEPNLTALSGETASFLVGGEFPIPIPQGNTGAVTVMFKKFGVSLSFTPTILENGKINLQVRPEVSQLSTQGAVMINGFQVPSLTTRRAQTTVELRSGQSFSIAGLLQNNANKMVRQLPGIGNVPILGRLFRSERFQRDETELVIIVTPYIVQPAGNQQFRYPTDNANADITASYSKPTPRYKNVGFILD